MKHSMSAWWRVVALAAWIGVGAVGTVGPTAQGADDRPPNIVFILADDLGWTDLGCQGSTYYETPHLDRLAAQGLRFTQATTAGPNCQPTRAALITGQYGPRTGIYTVGSIERFNWRLRPLQPVDNVETLDPSAVTFAEVLKSAGYATGFFGKWHLGDGPSHPCRQGFDEALVTTTTHFHFRTNPPVELEDGVYQADFLTDRAVEFIKRHQAGPFLLCVQHFAVHSPYQAKPEWIERFRSKAGAPGHRDPTYAAMIASVDESVGRIVAQIDRLALDRQTLVIFTSDNGGVGGYAREGLRRSRDVTDNAPLRGGKGMLYEGGIRVPFLARWPGRVPGGVVCDEPIQSIDLFPTLLELAGVAPPADLVLDGTSFVGLLETGRLQTDVERPPLFWHFPGYLGAGEDQWRATPVGVVRAGDWKLMEFFEDGHFELYNLKDDPGETCNRAADQVEKVAELHQRLIAWRRAINAPMPTPNPRRPPADKPVKPVPVPSQPG